MNTCALLTTQIQLCLAHYCDLHGPTPLMVTEGLPVPCSHCFDESPDSDRPQTSAATPSQPPSVTDALRKMHLSSSRSSSLPASEQEVQRAAVRHGSKLATISTTKAAATAAIETPPQSPRKIPEPGSHESALRPDPIFRRTYDDGDTKRANPCQNCALTLPKRQDSKTTQENGAKPSQAEPRGPTLRTRTPYARVYGGSSRDTSPPNSNPQSSCTSDAEDDDQADAPSSSRSVRAQSSSGRRPTTSASHSSVSSKSSMQSHTHFLDYTSTHEPQIANTYSIVRASCLRTLSFETLPRRPEHGNNPPSSPMSNGPPTIPPGLPYAPPSAVSSQTPTSQSSGGPIFFGDPLAGYTTAYIFRIPDRHARGRRRVYAFLALSTHRERVAMKAFNFLSVHFRDLAEWIVKLADTQAEREREREEEGSPLAGMYSQHSGGYSGGDAPGPRDSGIGLGLGGGSADRDRDRDSGSSFLTGGSRNGFVQRMSMGGSMGPGGFAPKARGLAEVVGMPDFFIELHAQFVKLLLELGVVMGS